MELEGLSQVSRPELAQGDGPGTGSDNPESFADMLGNYLDQVNQDQWAAKEANWGLITGEVDNLHDVVMAAERAEVSLQLTSQIRNKVLEAYQEMMRMQV